MTQKLEVTGMRRLLNTYFTLGSFSKIILAPYSAHRGGRPEGFPLCVLIMHEMQKANIQTQRDGSVSEMLCYSSMSIPVQSAAHI